MKKRKNYCEDDRALAQIAQRGCAASFLKLFKSHLDKVLDNIL